MPANGRYERGERRSLLKCYKLAEGVRFELTARVNESLVFKTSSLNRSDIPPHYVGHGIHARHQLCNTVIISHFYQIVNTFFSFLRCYFLLSLFVYNDSALESCGKILILSFVVCISLIYINRSLPSLHAGILIQEYISCAL